MLRFAFGPRIAPGSVTTAYRRRFTGGAGRAAGATTSLHGPATQPDSNDAAAVVEALRDIRDSQARASRWTRASSIAIVSMAGATLLGGLFAFVRSVNRSRMQQGPLRGRR